MANLSHHNLPVRRGSEAPLRGVVLPSLPDLSSAGEGRQCRALRVVQSVEALFEPSSHEDLVSDHENRESERSTETWLPAENVQPLFSFRKIRVHQAVLERYRQPDRSGPLSNTITFIA